MGNLGHEDPLYSWYSGIWSLLLLKNLPQSGHPGKGPVTWTARQALSETGRCEQGGLFSPLCCKAGAMHGGAEASQIRAGRYSQVKHQEHEARRLVGIDESDWGKRQKGRETEMERSHAH